MEHAVATVKPAACQYACSGPGARAWGEASCGALAEQQLGMRGLPFTWAGAIIILAQAETALQSPAASRPLSGVYVPASLPRPHLRPFCSRLKAEASLWWSHDAGGRGCAGGAGSQDFTWGPG